MSRHGRGSLAHRLSLKIYVALLASLALFALAVGVAWRLVSDDIQGRGGEYAVRLALNVLPPADAAPAVQQQALERLARGIPVDVALYGPGRQRLAQVGAALPSPDEEDEEHGWVRGGRGAAAWSQRLPDGRWVVARLPWQPRSGFGFVALALLAILAAVALASYPVVRRLTRRLERLQAGVESLGAGDLSARVAVHGRDEVARLAESFNSAAARIQGLVAEQKGLLESSRHLFATASHELRTPLARIRLAIELAREGVGPARTAELERDIAELDALIDEILETARLDSVPAEGPGEDVDLLALAAEEAARYDEAELDGQPVSLRGDARLLRRLIRNLLENARRHGAPPIELRVARMPTGAELSVSDRGPGVPEADRERVFEPFYRPPGSREASGYGLGLALVRRIARRHGGDAVCLPRDGGGSCFKVTLI